MALWDDPKIQEIRERRTEAETDWNPILEEARKDRLCVAGRPWEALDPKGLQARKAANRPYLALDELGQYTNQAVNDVRANPRGIRFAPTGNGANDQGAEFYQNHVREIEYRSHARIAYSNAFDQAVTASIGWIRITTKREHPRTFNQDLWIEPIMNADQVLPSPGFVWPDARDVQYLFYLEPWPERDFVRRFPDAEVKSFTPEMRRVVKGWVGAHTVDVAEYWAIVPRTRRLVAFRGSDGQMIEALIDELPDGKLPEGVENLREEDVEDTSVYSCLTNGIEVLKTNDWPGKYIPFVACTGKSLYVGADHQRQLMSLTRLARDPYMFLCYINSSEAEAIGGVPRNQWVGYKGQFGAPKTAQRTAWEEANVRPVVFTEAEPMVEGAPPNIVLPLPQRQQWDPPIQNLELAAESKKRAVAAAMGISPLPTPMQRQNQKSGAALDKIESSMQRGSFHYVDHYELMVERTGVILEDLIDKTLDAVRQVPVRRPDDSADIVWINDPQNPDSISTKGSYRVTISAGPDTDSQREEARHFVDAMVGNLATIAQLSGPTVAVQVLAKSIKLKQLGPIGDEIVDLLAPQEIGEDGKPVPPEVAKLLGENKQLKQMLEQAAKEKQAKVVEQQGKAEIAGMQEQADTARVAMREQAETARAQEANMLALLIAKMEDRLARLELEWKAHEASVSRDEARMMPMGSGDGGGMA